MSGIILLLLITCGVFITITILLNLALYHTLKKLNQERKELIERCALIIDRYGDDI